MTYQEALNYLNNAQVDMKSIESMCEASDLIETCKKAIEKQIPKKPRSIDKNAGFDGNWIKVCPSCGMKLVERITTNDVSYPRIYHRCKYCDCGQALDWGDE